MGLFTKLARAIFAGYNADGTLRRIPWLEVATWGTEVERNVEGASAGRVDQTTWAGLSAITGTRNGQPGVVWGPDPGTHVDPVTLTTTINVGFYAWYAGNSAWRRVANLPADTVIATVNAGAGTANAVQVTTAQPFSTDANESLFTVVFDEANSGAMTLSINGETPRDIVTNAGDPLPSGYVSAGMQVILQIDTNGDYRLFTFGDAEASQIAAEAAAAQAEAWAEGTEPGGPGTKASKEWALVALGAVTVNRVKVRGTIDDGVGPYDVGVTIGAAENIDIKIGGVWQDGDTYTVDGTEFTLDDATSLTGLPWEAVITAEVRSLGAASDGTVTRTSLGSTLTKSVPISAAEYGAVFDNSSGDRAKIKAAALAAAAAGVPFIVPNAGLDPDEGLVIQVPEDFSTVQIAHDAMLNWIFPGVAPGNSATLPVPTNFDRKIAVTVSASAAEHVSSGVGIVWNHPSWQFIKLKGRGAVGLTLASFQQSSYTSGVHLTRLRFTALPDPVPVVGASMQILLPTGTALFGEGDIDQLEGIWRIHAVDAVNKDITLAVYSHEMTSSFDIQSLTGGIYAYLPCGFRSIGLGPNGAQNAGIDVMSGLIAEDFYVSGNASGTNDPESNGFVLRYNSHIELYGFGGCLEWQRCGLWGLMGSTGQLGKWAFCGNISSGINCIECKLDGQYVSASGNLGHGAVIQTGGDASFPLGNFGGNGGTGVLVTNSGSIICSGKANKCDIGVDVRPGGFANIQDMQVRDCTTMGVRRRGGGRIMLTENNVDDFDPPLDTGDTYGGFTALESTLNAVT